MRAVVVEAHGGPEVLQVREVPDPEPGPGELLVAVAAAGVNFIDAYRRSGLYPTSLPFVSGSEGAGVVQGVGEGVTEFAEGDVVAWAMVEGAGYAELALVPAARAVPVPEGVALETAAAVMLQGMTAHYLCESTFPARAGQTALVHAAAGGMGLLLTQMLTRKGVRVIGTTSTDEKEQLARVAGAAEVVRYTEGDVVAEVARLTDGRGVDVVYDGVGRTTFDASLRVLVPRGMMVLFGASSGPVPPVDPQRLNQGGSLFLTRPSLAHYILTREELLDRSGAVLGQVAAGHLDVRVGAATPWTRRTVPRGSGGSTYDGEAARRTHAVRRDHDHARQQLARGHPVLGRSRVDDFDKAKAFYGPHGRPRGLGGLHPRADVRVVSRCHAAPGTTCRFPHQSPTATSL